MDGEQQHRDEPDVTRVEAAVEEVAEEHPNWIPIIASVGLALSIVALVLLVHPLRQAVTDALSGDTASLREDLRGFGFGGVLLVLALALSHAIIFYPAEILDAAVGFVYGFWLGMPLIMVGWMLNALVCHQIGRHAARPALVRMFGAERFGRYEGVVERGGITLLLACRMVPIVPFSLFSYVAGSARVPLGTFMWTTAVGYLPLTALFVYLGSKLEELSPNDPAIWVGAVGLIFFVFVTKKVLPMLSGAEADET
ncbi:MAG: VTT domain-containing protein [Solirubrobacterales bacterium]